MKVAIAGGHGKVGQRLIRLLAASRDEVRSLDRDPGYADQIRALGAEPLTCDLESAGAEEVAEAITGVDAVVFAAGAGPGSGPERKWTMDHGGAVKLLDAARANRIPRYVIVSSIGADAAAEGEDTFSVYLRAKGKADEVVVASGLDYTVVRPTSLSDEPGTGHVEAGASVERREIPRDDVAAVLAACLRSPNTIGKTFELTAGETPIADAVATL